MTDNRPSFGEIRAELEAKGYSRRVALAAARVLKGVETLSEVTDFCALTQGEWRHVKQILGDPS